MTTLQLQDTSYCYSGSDKNVLKSINATFEAGTFYAIIGKSGAGKSTLLSLIAGLDTATSGAVLYGTKDLKKIDRDTYRAKSVGVIFQSYNLLINATALDNIVLSLNISGVRHKRKEEYAYKLLERVGIDTETANRKVLKLSGGEQQRVGIARALAHNPSIIIADEPTGNLDSETEASILAILASLAHDDNKCVIVVTHAKTVSDRADQIWGLNSGKLVYVK